MRLVRVLPVIVLLATSGVQTQEQDFVLRVALVIGSSDAMPPGVIATALDEAAAIWARYGVVLERATTRRTERASAAGDPLLLTVESAESRGWVDPGRTPLGMTSFAPDGQPVAIVIFYDGIALTVAGSGLLAADERHGTSLWRNRLLALVLGRTIAHEVGHAVLRWPGHSAAGLMRPFQSATELAHPNRTVAALDPSDIARLRQVRNHWRRSAQ